MNLVNSALPKKQAMGKQHHGDLDESVVDDAGADVDDVEDGERHQQVVEGRSHLGLPEVETIIRVLNVTIYS